MREASPFRAMSIAAVLAGATLVAACAGTGPAVGGHAGESSLANKTFAGQNKCSPTNHERPFIIEWDATDQSSFQAHASKDVVVVHYQGCDLKVLDGCRNDSVRGDFGSYNTPDWTSGNVETLDISDEGELYAKLPLGAATLGGRVQSGEKFHMEYYVSGTSKATRDQLYRKDLEKNPACKGATHFVYAYNLGAFALASQKSLKGEVHGSYFGFGGGGSKATETKADKKGGELGSCKGESAREVESCKVPIRLTLRAINEGENPTAVAAQAPETDKAANLAGQVKAETDREKQAQELFMSAQNKMRARDGKGCLADLDQHDVLDPRPGGLSTMAKAGYPALVRGQCLMLAGQCDAGKQLYRKAWEAGPGAGEAKERVDTITDATAGLWCQGGSMGARDQFMKARMDLQNGAFMAKKEPAFCMAAFKTMWSLKDTVKPKDDEDQLAKDPLIFMMSAAPGCLVKAGDCDGAYTVYKQIAGELYKQYPWSKDETQLRRNFETMNSKCKK